MKSIAKSLMLLLVIAAFAAPANAQEVPNESYKNWSQFNVGTSTTLKTVTKMGGKKISEIKITQKLVEKNDDQVVVEVSTVVIANGMEFKTGANKVTHKKSVKSSSAQPADVKGVKVKELDKGEEKVKVGDASYACNWISSSSEFQGMKSESKVWMSDKVPGMVVKTVMSTSSGIESTTELVGFTKK